MTLNLKKCISLTELPKNLIVTDELNLTDTPIIKRYNTKIEMRKYLKSINANVSQIRIDDNKVWIF